MSTGEEQKPVNDKYRKQWDAIFGKQKQKQPEEKEKK